MTDALTPLAIRDAVPGDATAIAALHHALWHRTYASLAPPEMPPLMTVESRLARWCAILDRPAGDQVFVAWTGAMLAGFVLMGPPTEPVPRDCCEIKHLFVRAELQGRGIGRRLLAEAARRALGLGFTRLGLGVVDGNGPAIAFYAAVGGKPSGSYTDPGPRWRSHNLLFVWEDLPALAARWGPTH